MGVVTIKRYNVHMRFAHGIEHTFANMGSATSSWLRGMLATKSGPLFMSFVDGDNIVYVNRELLAVVEFKPVEGERQ